MITCEWTPDGVIVKHQAKSGCVGTGTYGTIEQALEGIRILLQNEEEQYLFPADKYPTAAHRDAEILARAIEERLTQKDSQSHN